MINNNEYINIFSIEMIFIKKKINNIVYKNINSTSIKNF